MYIERWAIDELSEVTATLLVTQYQRELPRLRDLLDDDETLESEIMEREPYLDSDDWTEEQAFVLLRDGLQEFITSRRPRNPRLRSERERQDIREGDVFWVTSRDQFKPLEMIEVPENEVDEDGPSLLEADTEVFLSSRGGRVRIIDITWFARKVAKDVYRRAVERSG